MDQSDLIARAEIMEAVLTVRTVDSTETAVVNLSINFQNNIFPASGSSVSNPQSEHSELTDESVRRRGVGNSFSRCKYPREQTEAPARPRF